MRAVKEKTLRRASRQTRRSESSVHVLAIRVSSQSRSQAIRTFVLIYHLFS